MNTKKLLLSMFVAIFTFCYSGISLASTVPNTATSTTTKTVVKNEVGVANTTASKKAVSIEHLPKIKNVSSNLVNITEDSIMLPKGDVFKVAFAQDFTTKNLNVGDKILFTLPDGLYTQEGTFLLPAGTKIMATVQSFNKPKSFNRNARVMLDFNEIILPEAPACSMGACVYGKHNALQPSAWATVAKPAIWTAGLFGVGAGLGAAIGAAAGAAGLGCLAIGMPVGGGVGLIIGLVTPGLHYKAKAGKKVPVMLTQDMVLVKTTK